MSNVKSVIQYFASKEPRENRVPVLGENGRLEPELGGTGSSGGTNTGQLFYWDGNKYQPIPLLTWIPEFAQLKIESRVVDRTNSVITETSTVENSTAEETIYTGSIDADFLRAGNYLKSRVNGKISNASASSDLTIRVYLGETLMETFHPAIGNVTDADWHIDINMTIRSIGTSGSVAFHSLIDIAGFTDKVNLVQALNTEVAEDIKITIQWDAADIGNVIECHQGILEYKH